MLTGINHITLAVSDINRSFEFYRDIFGFEPLCKWDSGAYFLCGDFWFCLNVDANTRPSADYTHYAFSVSAENFKTICDKIIAAGVKNFQQNTSEGDSLYFLDPDGHKLEIHVGDWKTRIAAKKADCGLWKNLEWFDLTT
jgi:catechol 2,3-dioxygenase-like lactoylglutathione lyase family enzyme